ncbi:hypothetical protein [Streptomyces sp. IBSBF 2435]|uniref:hypothetical protein n=1 Tax=Streptomyces sp. IBSBF 2435 TaxID=2903531 RepID=UPI002FDBB686
MSQCPICRHELPVGEVELYACRACEYRLAYVLQQLVAEIPLLHAQLAPYRSPSLGSIHGGRAAHAPLPVDARVLDLLATRWIPDPGGDDAGGIPIGPLLVGWCSLLAADYPAVSRRAGTWYIEPGTEPWPAAGGIPGWAAWLRRYIPYAATWRHAPDLWADLEDALARVRAITGTQPRTRPRWAPCPRCDAYALTRTDGHWHIRCQACGHRMDSDAYNAHATETAARATAPAHPKTATGEAA